MTTPPPHCETCTCFSGEARELPSTIQMSARYPSLSPRTVNAVYRAKLFGPLAAYDDPIRDAPLEVLRAVNLIGDVSIAEIKRARGDVG